MGREGFKDLLLILLTQFRTMIVGADPRVCPIQSVMQGLCSCVRVNTWVHPYTTIGVLSRCEASIDGTLDLSCKLPEGE